MNRVSQHWLVNFHIDFTELQYQCSPIDSDLIHLNKVHTRAGMIYMSYFMYMLQHPKSMNIIPKWCAIYTSFYSVCSYTYSYFMTLLLSFSNAGKTTNGTVTEDRFYEGVDCFALKDECFTYQISVQQIHLAPDWPREVYMNMIIAQNDYCSIILAHYCKHLYNKR